MNPLEFWATSIWRKRKMAAGVSFYLISSHLWHGGEETNGSPVQEIIIKLIYYTTGPLQPAK